MGLSAVAITEPILSRIRGEYLEMPGLSLTPDQAQRLWGLDRQSCERVMRQLVDSKFLWRTSAGNYVLRQGRC
jgi:hypothetical protein